MGELLLEWRKLVCGAMILPLPVYLVADDAGAAMLRDQGGVRLNGNPAPPSSALFRYDNVQTARHSEATIDTTGSTVTVKEETMIQYEDNELFLEHGTVLVSTSRAMAVRVGCLIVIPVNAEWTQYDITDVDGKIVVNAHTRDVYVERRDTRSQQIREKKDSDRAIVHEGEQATREEKCGAYEKLPGHIAGKGAFLNSPWAKELALGGIGIGVCWVICRGDDPISPSHP